ncbi:hypothetical protein FJZ40_04375 [Candidatus Shapirobacteria bacterium]|nr:hypothetical protein [Candidatus Shapirobacteria bacterium]
MEENITQDQLPEIQGRPVKRWLRLTLLSLLGLTLVGGLIAAIEIGVPTKPREKACTSEAKICPDGSAVGRVGPNCEFAPCPNQVVQDETANWKTYQDKTLFFRYPQDWSAELQQIPDSIVAVEFKYNLTPTFTLTERTNLNDKTGKAFATLDEYFAERGNNEDIMIGGNPAKKIATIGIEGHVLPYEEVVLFTPDRSTVISLYYRRENYEKPEADRIFDLILSTFRFLE